MAITRARHGIGFWGVVVVTTVFITLEPGFFLVALAVALSALTVTWIMMLARLLILDAWAKRSAHREE